jgi:hypothetical protein
MRKYGVPDWLTSDTFYIGMAFRDGVSMATHSVRPLFLRRLWRPKTGPEKGFKKGPFRDPKIALFPVPNPLKNAYESAYYYR